MAEASSAVSETFAFQARIQWPTSTNGTLTCSNRSGCFLVFRGKCAMTPLSAYAHE